MTRLFLMTYDITAPRRLRRMHRTFRRFGVPIQYSVFLGRLTAARLAELSQTIAKIMHPRQDDVRLYPVPEAGWQRRLGKAVLPPGLTLTVLPESMRPALSPPDHDGKAPKATAGREGAKAQQHTKLSRSQARHAREQIGRQQTGQRRGIQVLS